MPVATHIVANTQEDVQRAVFVIENAKNTRLVELMRKVAPIIVITTVQNSISRSPEGEQESMGNALELSSTSGPCFPFKTLKNISERAKKTVAEPHGNMIRPSELRLTIRMP